MTIPIDEQETLGLLRDLVRLRTVNPPGDEAPAARLVAERLQAWGFETTVVPYGDNRAHTVGRLRGAGSAPGLMLSGHLDVVPPGEVPWQHDPFGAVVEDGRLYGRGACDMKGGVAAFLGAAAAVARAAEPIGRPPGPLPGLPLRGDLVVVCSSDEEAGCGGADALVKEPHFDGIGSVLIAEPSDLQLFIAEKGAFWLEVTLLGQTAHGSMPERGENAVAAMAEFLVGLRDLFPEALPPDPVLGRPTLNAGTIAGGVKINVVPDRCVVTLDMRTIPGQRHAAIRGQIEAMIAALRARRPHLRAEIRTLIDREPVACPTDTPLALAAAEAVAAVTGARPTPSGVSYFTEACVFVPRLGIPMVICGPGHPTMAHQPDEYVELRQVHQAAEVYARVALALLSDEIG
jgi:succinyl-diaminopimelate desuccinylase